MLLNSFIYFQSFYNKFIKLLFKPLYLRKRNLSFQLVGNCGVLPKFSPRHNIIAAAQRKYEESKVSNNFVQTFCLPEQHRCFTKKIKSKLEIVHSVQLALNKVDLIQSNLKNGKMFT